ncbi:MAG TPA: alginate export family protein [Thermodesulfobacteriota bacterium]|nr:alginate export family protein [Thermodesulfobacteriota bacterium]
MMIDRNTLSMVTIFFSLLLYATQSNAQESPSSEDERRPVFSSFDPDAPPETRIKVAPFLTFGAQIENEYRLERNLDLDGKRDEDLSTLEPELSLAFSFDPSRYIQVFTNLKLSGEFVFEDGDRVDDRVSLEFELAYLLFKNLLDDRLSFQIGRQRFDDERQWLYDAELDAARVFFQFSRFLVDISVSRGGLVDRDLLNDDVSERINNYIAYLTYAISEETYAAAYVLFFDDRSKEEKNPIFFGIHSDGDITESLGYWLEMAYVGGKEGSNRIRGFGFDIGANYAFDLPLEPSITLGYAFGTGDGDPDDGVDRSFRQTGLQGNEGDFNGVTDFKYYGELFDPELSNLSILTVGAGINPTEESSIDLVYHYYLQHKASDELREAGIDTDPDGLDKSLGSEIDIVIGYVHEGIKGNVELALMLGYFLPGRAFPSESENAFLTKLVVQFEF